MDDEPGEAESCKNHTKIVSMKLSSIQSINLAFEAIVSKEWGIAVSFFCRKIRRLRIGY
ncbi:hypothetical protein [Acetobacterium bakii]|uniref:hypothetical protein n=1 Tax=Acetobacterium bakii TaxID=52689 RepID=UPI001364D2CF|nr:hypothetical protein [Acetobacterium bakii]